MAPVLPQDVLKVSLVAGATMGAVMLALNAQGPSTTALLAAHNVGQMRTGQGVRPVLPFAAARGPLSQPPAPAPAAARPSQAAMHEIYSRELSADQVTCPILCPPSPPGVSLLLLPPPRLWGGRAPGRGGGRGGVCDFTHGPL